MPQPLAESSWGSFRAGSWVVHDSESYCWDSLERDPYHGLLISTAMARRLARSFADTNARDFVQFLQRRGISMAFIGNVFYNNNDEIMDAFIDTQGVASPYLESFRTNFWFEDMLRLALERRGTIPDSRKWVCVQPNCYHVEDLGEGGTGAAKGCNNCGEVMAVHSSMISVDVGPGIVPSRSYRSRLDELIKLQAVNRDILKLVKDSNGVFFIHWPHNANHPVIATAADRLTTSKQHHITKRANYSFLSRLREPRGFYRSDARQRDYDSIGWTFIDIKRMRPEPRRKLLDALQRFSDNPNGILDEGVANELRTQLVESSWNSGGRRKFGMKLDELGVLKVSVGRIPKEFIDLLYNKLINSSKLNIIIKRNGVIDYRLDRIATKISKRAIEQAFDITETRGNIEDMFDVASLV